MSLLGTWVNKGSGQCVWPRLVASWVLPARRRRTRAGKEEEAQMSLTPKQLQALRQWMESKEISICPVCGEEEGFGNVEEVGSVEDRQEEARAGDVALNFLPSRASGVEAIKEYRRPIIGRERRYGGIVEEKRRSVGKVIVDLEKGIKIVTKLLRDLGLNAGRKPIVRITCGSCGNIVLLDARRIGIMDAD
jgi:hypothetical protein